MKRRPASRGILGKNRKIRISWVLLPLAFLFCADQLENRRISIPHDPVLFSCVFTINNLQELAEYPTKSSDFCFPFFTYSSSG